MKVRLYRGPHDGKVMFMRDHETIVQFLEAPEIDWSAKQADYPIGTTKVTYQRTGHSHPDGSVYFEWDKPKGTRMPGKRRKPNKKYKQPNYNVTLNGVPGQTITTSTFQLGGPYTITVP